MDLAIAVLPYPETALRPSHARVTTTAGRRNRRNHVARNGIDLVDARFGNLIEIFAIKGGACVADDVERARGLTARGIEGDQLRAGCGPDANAIMGDAMDAFEPGEGSILAHDLRRMGLCCLRFCFFC